MLLEQYLHSDNNAILPEKLYHYTSLDNFVKIVDSKRIFLFSSYQMADYKENFVVVEILHELLRTNEIILPEEHMVKLNTNFYDRFYSILKYVSCFSTLYDSLSQWRSYGDDGNGVCIIIDPRKINIPYQLPKQNGLVIHDIIYSKDIQKALVKEMVEISLNSFEKHNADNFVHMLTELMISFSPLFKLEEFKEEAEWRIIYTPQIMMGINTDFIATLDDRTDINFINTRNNIKSYFILNSDESDFCNMIEGVLLGPKNKITNFEINAFMRAKKLLNKSIFRSSISHR